MSLIAPLLRLTYIENGWLSVALSLAVLDLNTNTAVLLINNTNFPRVDQHNGSFTVFTEVAISLASFH